MCHRNLVIDDIVFVICFRSCWLSHEVKLARESGSLGFSIAGCKDSHHGDQPVFIKSVRSGSAADKNNIRYVLPSQQSFHVINNPPSLDDPSLLIMLGVILSMLRIVQLLHVYIPLKCQYICFHLPCSHSLLV